MEIEIARIIVPEDRRPLDQSKVDEIAASIKALGLLSPIGIKRNGDASSVLVWGRHRLAACARLGWKTIQAVAVDGLAYDRGLREDADITNYVQLTEITENLHRAELTTEQRNEQLAIWVEIYNRNLPLPNLATEPPNSKPGPKPDLGILAAAKLTGRTKKHVKDVIRSTKISPEVKAAADRAELTQKQRLKIARKASEGEQLAAIEAMKSAPCVDGQEAGLDRDFSAQSESVRLSMTAQQKLEAAIRQEKCKLHLEHAARLRAVDEEVRQRVIAENAEYLAMVKEREANVRKKEELWREIFNEHKPLFTADEFRTILMCLHPDGQRTADKLADAFRLFNAKKLQLTGIKS